MLTEFTPEDTMTTAGAVWTGLGFLAIFAICGLLVLIGERTYSLTTRERMRPLPAILRATLQVLVGGPLRLHQRRMAAVRAASHTCQAERTHAMLRHPSARGYRHLRAVPDRVA